MLRVKYLFEHPELSNIFWEFPTWSVYTEKNVHKIRQIEVFVRFFLDIFP